MTQPSLHKALQRVLFRVFLVSFFSVVVMATPSVQAIDPAAYLAQPPLSDGMLPCPNSSMATRLNEASAAYFVTTQKAIQDQAETSWESDRLNPKKYQRGKIMDTYCLGMYLDFFNVINQLISGFSLIESAIKALINQVLNTACNYVYNAASGALNTFCLPLPSLSFSVDLPAGPSHKTCNGISLGDAMRVTPGKPLRTMYPLSQVYQTRPMSRWMGNGRF